jgi:nucleotide-binding universal stress UspA family protein
MHRILVPIDTDEDRVDAQLRFLAMQPGKEDIKVTLLHISPENIPDSPDSVPEIKHARSHLQNEGIDLHVTVRISDEDSASNEIRKVAEEVDADQIVMGGRKRSPTGKLIFGSVTQSVLTNTDLPVTITGSE